VVLSGSVHLLIPGDASGHAGDIELGLMLPGAAFGEVAVVDDLVARNAGGVVYCSVV